MAASPRSWNDPPSVMVISGNQHFLRERAVRKAMWAASVNSRVIEHMDGNDQSELSSKVSGSVLFSQESMVIVANPQKASLELLWSHHEDGDDDLCLVLHHTGKINGNTKFGKMVKKLAKWQHLEFLEPARHKAKEEAVRFCRVEAKRKGFPLEEKLAMAVVRNAGTDYGVLSYELQKAAAFATSLGAEEIQSTHIAQTISMLGSEDAIPVTEAIGMANGPKVLKEMARLRRASNRDPTMLLVALISRGAAQWLQAAALDASGVDSKSAARQVGVPAFVYERFIIPVGRRWGQKRLVQLIKEVSRVEKAVKTGAISPWLLLEATVYASCVAVRGRG
ncbi:hypothetical protein N9917_01230 [Deltaproteobacteria bacterium]|nr:hypothetical protein [Deltaproteobacteria bacterium]